MADIDLAAATHLHVAVCPAAANLPVCTTAQQCSFSCVSLYVDHLENCTRCVQHLCGSDVNAHTINACSNNHCRRVANCWHLKGDLIDFGFRHKLPLSGYVFEQLSRQLEALFKLDFENISYTGNAGLVDGADDGRRQYVAKNTAMLFDCLRIFQAFAANMRACEMSLDGSDLAGILQTFTHQLSAMHRAHA